MRAWGVGVFSCATTACLITWQIAMQRKLWALLAVLLGSSVVLGSVVAWVAWLTFCFGTVIVGIALLFLAPGLLIAPLLIGGRYGLALISVGMVGFE